MQSKEKKETLKAIVKVSRYTAGIALVVVACIVVFVISLFDNGQIMISPTQVTGSKTAAPASSTVKSIINSNTTGTWKAPDVNTIPAGKAGDIIRYGKELLAHTANYLGPKGTVAQISNGMNCQNCHLEGGSKLFANNYGSFIATYPKMSYRSGHMAPATERITDCFERSLAGKLPDTSSREVKAILAYMKWIGRDVKKGQKLYGNATEKLPFLNAAADPLKGKSVYILKCQVCHGTNGEGLLAANKRSYTYPPLWGSHSYNDGAGMYRIGNFAGFVKNNMPFGANYNSPQLTDEEAWNVAAFVNSQPRPHRDQHNDWKDLKNKPIDFPFGPYQDAFSERQHKYGPFNIIAKAKALTIKKL